MIRRLLVPFIVVAATLVPAANANGTAVLGVRPDPGARLSVAPLHQRIAVWPGAPPVIEASAAATKKKAPTGPVITGVSPLTISVGQKLTIKGRNFLSGRHRDTVVFYRKGAPAIFVRADSASHTKITLVVPASFGTFLAVRGGASQPTRFQLRVLARRFGAAFTPRRLSPTIRPASASGGGGSSGKPGGPPACNPLTATSFSVDSDGDGLSDGLEHKIGTNPCLADTDGDGITDGYEYQSALDLNSRALPYPGKRPYPNPLDPTDANTDYDGDGLTMKEEYTAWVRYGNKSFPLNYSDGTQYTGGPVAVTPATQWQDLNNNGYLSDDEKDIDNDGLTNFDETHGRMLPSWWQGAYSGEQPYILTYQGTDWLDADTDGDGLIDGNDDVDHDGWTNHQELDRNAIGLWVQPFNPCLPDWHSPTCALHPPFTAAYPPFDGTFNPAEPTPLVWPRP
jgi:Bacterial TSP3 repeat/IPT/TIG domain